MNNELRNILIHVNILKNQLKDISMDEEIREKIDFRILQILERINYLINDELDSLKYKEKILIDNITIINDMLMEVQ